MIKNAIFILSFIPLCIHLPYLFSAWQGSRLDKFDWVFYILAIPAAIWAARKEKSEKCDYSALLLLIPMLFLSLTTKLHNINALAIAASVGVSFAAVWLLFSWKISYKTLPAAMILLLGTPSSSYQLSLLMMCPVWAAWIIKFLIAILCFVWIGCNKYFDLQIKKGTLFFTAAVAGSSLLLMHTRELYFEGKAFIPRYDSHIGDYWGRSIQPDANTLRFFATSKVEQFRYTKGNIDISVLSVKCGNNIHEIHPASHCLRTSLWTVHSERILYLQDNFAVTEIDAEKGKNRILVWVWYSSDKFSTPAFLGFRRHFQPDGNYYTCQISIPVYDKTEYSRELLKRFIQFLNETRKK